MEKKHSDVEIAEIKKIAEIKRIMEIVCKQKPRTFISFTCNQNSLNTCFVYTDGPRYDQFKGCAGNLLIITLSDGRIIVTNDLWYETYVPGCNLSGTVRTYNNEIVSESYVY